MPSTKPNPIRPDEDERAAEQWLATEGVARFDAHVAAPAETVSADEAGARLRRHMARRAAHKKA